MGRMWPRGGRDPWFTEHDRLVALALQAEDDDRCPDCGQPRVESFAPENEGAYEAIPYQCHACNARESRSAQLAKDGAEMHGWKWIVNKINGRRRG